MSVLHRSGPLVIEQAVSSFIYEWDSRTKHFKRMEKDFRFERSVPGTTL